MRPRSLAVLLAAAAVPALVLAAPGAAALAGASSAPATVFLPNPVATLQDQTLTDQKDADYAALQRAYRDVTLTHLDGSGSLSGDYARVTSETGKSASVTDGFRYHRNDDRFEQVMAYYWITQAQLYLQSLGFGSTYADVNKRSVPVRINQYGGDNSFFRDDQVAITYGKGGVDDAEDAEVVVHEYGHSVQNAQVPGFGTNLEAGSIGEGFSDYLAVAVAHWVSPTKDEACVADWDSVSYTSKTPHCLRRVDSTKTYPTSLRNEVHADGEIWSSALWSIRRALGAAKADTVIVDAQFGFAPDTSMQAAAATTIATAQRLYGSATAKQVREAFAARGLA
jgi:Zn-dependent metalloprotease